MCLHELSVVNDTLEVLGTPKKYQWLHNWIIRITIGWIVYIFFYTALSSYILSLDSDIHFVIIYYIFLMNYPKFINILNALIWGIIFGLVYCSRMTFKYLCADRANWVEKFHFTISAIINFNKILITKNHRILEFSIIFYALSTL